MILESIVTTVDEQGRVNVAPMGPRVENWDSNEISFVLRPFDSSQTYRNLLHSRVAVIHVTDDADLIARAAVNLVGPQESADLVCRIGDRAAWRLKDCHRWFLVEVASVIEGSMRVEMPCRVVDSGIVRPFFGFNRGKHAVIEAAILATRTHILPPDEILRELERLQPLVEKTAAPEDARAFELLRQTIHDRLARLRTEQPTD